MKYLTITILLILISCINEKSNKKVIVSLKERISNFEENIDNIPLDSLKVLLSGTKIGEQEFLDLDGNIIKFDTFSKPIFLEATASWCKPCIAQIPAINSIVDLYHNQVEFVFFTQDTQEKAQDIASNLHPKIKVIPSLKKVDPNGLNKIDVGGFQHILPFPTTYFVNSNKIISDIKVGGPVPSDNTDEALKVVLDYNLKTMTESIIKLLPK